MFGQGVQKNKYVTAVWLALSMFAPRQSETDTTFRSAL